MAPLGWTMIVEQPTREADANATGSAAAARRRDLGRPAPDDLVGYFFGRQFITPILALQRGTQALAAGRLEERVDIRTGDEFAELGQAFNTMADKLVELQENIKRQERQAMFGRIAAGLVHDLSHPIQNIGNSTRLLLRDDVDPESRDMFRRTIERELATLSDFMDDLRNIVETQAHRAVPDGRQRLDRRDRRVDARRRRPGRRGPRDQYAAGPLIIEGDASPSAASTAT